MQTAAPISHTHPDTPSPNGDSASEDRCPLPSSTPLPHRHAPRIVLGESRSPSGEHIEVTAQSLLRDGEPWLPVMGEFHYARYPRAEWRDALLAMRMGGIDIVATYVFWIHHEEAEGEWDWSERRSLREFIQTCGEVELSAVVRMGPWCHGECRNGGLPDWLLRKPLTPRSDDPAYLACVRRLYGEIANQVRGLLWKDGGPIVGVQFENEYTGPAEHLLTLKRIALELGLDVPLYTRTGWPDLRTPMPLGELLPLYGGYPDGFWDRSLREMPPGYGANFLFRTSRNDASVATDQLGIREIAEEPDNAHYPYFACEIGGGMMTSYHRRIRIAGRDIEALALARLGSGNNLQGYYMYHGGTNPVGRFSTLQESQATGYWNDLPERTYDFQAPLGEFGQVRPHYHALRRIHLFLRDWGATLAAQPTYLPSARPQSDRDADTLRWSARTDGRSGFVFVNNYQRLQEMPAKPGVRFEIPAEGGPLTFPTEPVTVPANSCFFWPYRLGLADAVLRYATAQPVCQIARDGEIFVFFTQTEGVPTEFVWDAATATLESGTGTAETVGEGLRIRDLAPGADVAMTVRARSGGTAVHVILLSPEQSLTCWKADFACQERVFLTRAALLIDAEAGALRLRAEEPSEMAVAIFPPLSAPLMCSGNTLSSAGDGIFQSIACLPDSIATLDASQVTIEQRRAAGDVPPVQLGGEGVAEPLSDAEFDRAASIWRLRIAAPPAHAADALLRIRYTGDIARLYLDGALLTDNFYNGTPFEVGLGRYAPDIYEKELVLKILPLRDDAPIYLPADAQPAPEGSDTPPHLELVPIFEARLTLPKAHAQKETQSQ